MYRSKDYEQIEFELPFGFLLNRNSKWVKLADIMPWKEIEEQYSKHFKGRDGQVAKSSRLAFGALYIQTSEGFTDIQTREHIWENPHMQYFCGYQSYNPEPPFDSSLMVHFRKRIPAEMIQTISESFFNRVLDKSEEATTAQETAMETEEFEELSEQTGAVADTVDNDQTMGQTNKGTLILDATCCPQDIHYPTDMKLLNEVRETSEALLDAVTKLFQAMNS